MDVRRHLIKRNQRLMLSMRRSRNALRSEDFDIGTGRTNLAEATIARLARKIGDLLRLNDALRIAYWSRLRTNPNVVD
jgi:hypothetical protein